MRKIAFVGSARNSRELVPTGEGWEIWSILQNHQWLNNVSRFFEIHDISKWAAVRTLVNSSNAVVYTQVKEDGNTIVYPLADVVAHHKTKYFKSSFDYMMALALLEHDAGDTIEEIQLPGFEFQGNEEYGGQLPSASFWIGQAEGRGIRVVCCEHCAAKKSYGWKDGDYGDGDMYAFEDSGALKLINEKLLNLKMKKAQADEDIGAMKKQIEGLTNTYNAYQRELEKIEAAIMVLDDTRQLALRGY